MATIKSYTDLEQSKKLAEILPIESADMSWVSNGLGKPFARTISIKGDPEELCACWSLASLMDMLPSEFTTENKFGKYIYEIKIRKYNLIEDVDLYQIAYGNYKFYEDGSSSWKDMINTGEKENLIDAAFQMICWLKENEKI